MVRFKNIATVVVFILAIIFIFAAALHSLGEPLERDLTTYGYIGHALLSGEQLYSDLWDHKPPGIHIAFALAEIIWGYGQQSISFIWVLISILSIFQIYLILDKISGWQAALIGVIFYTLSSNSIHLQANQPNTEIFINYFTLIAIWALVQTPLPNTRHLHIAGWAMGIATMFKPVAIFLLAPMLFYVLIRKYSVEKELNYRSLLPTILILLYPVPLLWGPMFGYAFLQGRFHDFWDVLIVYNSQYAGSSIQNIWAFLTHPNYLFPQSLTGIWILVLLGYAWLFIGSRSKRVKVPHYFFILMTMGVLFEIGSLGKDFAHYFQVLIPVFVLNSSLLIYYVIDEMRIRSGSRLILVATLLSITLGTMINYQIEFFKHHPFELSHEKYKRQFIDARELGQEINAITSPDDLIYYWGSESGVYYYSQRKSASGIFYNLPLKDKNNKQIEALNSRLLADLEATPPAIFIWNSKEGPIKNSHLYDFVTKSYHLLGNRSYFQIYVDNPENYEF
ncbi:MAG: glycosyltransferase family 39 protein [FCB group bacterium]|nr:glycosyltransferase family 39 protein [FCB group bacterium]MBL7027683.1 glycosyltransferase family 39 protein [Candidatus Neomarinimicrobiota bacterium]MBL7121070.1 glycosyltransferase family 39 protein [Candidatus Neomarinimicrobiota bacterium]